MKLLITGFEGYIGTRLTRSAIKAGHNVTGLDVGFYRDGNLGGGIENPPEIIRKDIRDISAEDLRGFDTVIHLSELSNDPLGENNPALTFEINNKGTKRVAELAKKAGVKRFIYSSSCSVYGASMDLKNESSSVNPLTTYAKCKILNEEYIAKLSDDKFSPVFLRNATAYGLSPRMRFDLVINYLAGSALVEGEIKMTSDGNAWRPFVHVDDICRAMLHVLEAPKEQVHNKIFNVGGESSNYTIREIAGIISQALPGCKITLDDTNPDKRNYRVDFRKINTELAGFKINRDIKEGIKELISAFKAAGMKKKDFDSPEYYRLAKIKFLADAGKIDDKFYFKEYAV